MQAFTLLLSMSLLLHSLNTPVDFQERRNEFDKPMDLHCNTNARRIKLKIEKRGRQKQNLPTYCTINTLPSMRQLVVQSYKNGLLPRALAFSRYTCLTNLDIRLLFLAFLDTFAYRRSAAQPRDIFRGVPPTCCYCLRRRRSTINTIVVPRSTMSKPLVLSSLYGQAI